MARVQSISRRNAASPSSSRKATSTSPTLSSSSSSTPPLVIESQEAPPLDTSALTGLRVLLNLWIMAFHALFVIMYFLPEDEIKTLFGWISIIEHGYLAVDGFFILTGFLLVLPLVQPQKKRGGGEEQQTPSEPSPSTSKFRLFFSAPWWPSVHRYWQNRFLRIMIPYMFLYILHCFIINPCGAYKISDVRLVQARETFDLFFPGSLSVSSGCDSAWANALHIPYLLPFNGAFMHTWSLGVQYHVWLWFPVLWHTFDMGGRGGGGDKTLKTTTTTNQSEKEQDKRQNKTDTSITHNNNNNNNNNNNSNNNGNNNNNNNSLAYLTLLITVIAMIFRFFAQRHSSSPGFVSDSFSGGFQNLFWYSSPLARAHVILAGALVGQIAVRYQSWAKSYFATTEETTKKIKSKKNSDSRSSYPAWVVECISLSIIVVFFLVNTQWQNLTGGEDSRYTRTWYHSIYATILQVGTPLSSLAWGLILLGLVWRPWHISQAIARFLCPSTVVTKRFVSSLAELSFHAFLLHPMIMTALYSTPWLLYPPSAIDTRPLSDSESIRENIAAWLCSSGSGSGNTSTPTSDVLPVTVQNCNGLVSALIISPLDTWFKFRDVIAPSGHPMSYLTMMGVNAIAGIVVTYGLSWIGLELWEKPLIRWITSPAAAAASAAATKTTETKQSPTSSSSPSSIVSRISVYYSWIVMSIGLLSVPIVTGLVFMYVVPGIDDVIKAHFEGLRNSTNITVG